jgi:serine/threonine-protein phosphatase 5
MHSKCHVCCATEQAWYRRADAYFAMGKYKDALKDFRAAAKAAPRDPDVRRKLVEADKTVKRLRFEEALATPVRRPESMMQ